MKKLLAIARGRAAVMFSAALRADNFPSRPITFVAVFGPGSASDTICRIIADPLSAALKQPIIVEDRPGADGAVAAQYVQHAAPDGYTLMLATNSPLSADPFLLREVSYDPVKDFAPVTRVGSFTLMLVVNPNLPIHSVKELVDYAKANPGKLSYRQRQYRRRGRRQDAGALGRSRHAARALQKHAAGHRGRDRRPGVDDVLRFHRRHAACRLRPGAGAGGDPAATARRCSRICRPWTRPASRASNSMPGPASSRRRTPRRTSWLSSTPRCAKSSTRPRPRRNSAMSASRDSLSTPGEFGEFIKAQLGKWSKMVKDAGIQTE